VLAAVALTVGSASPVAAQEEVASEPAIIAPLAPRALALDAVSVGGTSVAVGERGHILISDDGGGSWRQAESPTRTALTGVFFADHDHGWAVGHDSAILRTTDGGTTWELVNWAPEDEAPLFDVWFADAENGFAIGAYGTFYVTADGGQTWAFEPISDNDFHLHDIAEAPDGRLYMAAEAGVAYRSDDGGITWTELPSPYEGSFFGVLPLADDAVLLFGLRGHVFRSGDAGETWEPVETGTVAMLTDGLQLQDGSILIVGLGGTVLKSTDDGRTFSIYQQPNRRGISAVVQADDGSLLLVGEFGVKTTSLDELTDGSLRAER
jgi:photosystem II stability/assembly factor-like uncharacterized protein